jgi:hypothetical protein
MRVRHDQTGVDGKALATDQALGHAAPDHRLEQLSQKVGVAEPTMARLGKGRVVRHIAIETQTAEPAIRQVQVDLFAQPPFRADAKAVADDQHADQQLGIDRRPSCLTVEWRQVSPNALEINKAVDRPQQVLFRHVPFERKLIE